MAKMANCLILFCELWPTITRQQACYEQRRCHDARSNLSGQSSSILWWIPTCNLACASWNNASLLFNLVQETQMRIFHLWSEEQISSLFTWHTCVFFWSMTFFLL